MGIFQYQVALLPRAYFGKQLPAQLSDAEIERGEDVVSGWWASEPPTEHLLAAVRSLLPTDKSWPGGDVEEYVLGGDYSSDIRIWKEGGRTWGITFRFSPAANSWPLMQRFLSVARGEHCLLLEEKGGAVIEPEEEIVRERLLASRAMQFVDDPAGTVVQAASELKDDAG